MPRAWPHRIVFQTILGANALFELLQTSRLEKQSQNSRSAASGLCRDNRAMTLWLEMEEACPEILYDRFTLNNMVCYAMQQTMNQATMINACIMSLEAQTSRLAGTMPTVKL